MGWFIRLLWCEEVSLMAELPGKDVCTKTTGILKYVSDLAGLNFATEDKEGEGGAWWGGLAVGPAGRNAEGEGGAGEEVKGDQEGGGHDLFKT